MVVNQTANGGVVTTERRLYSDEEGKGKPPHYFFPKIITMASKTEIKAPSPRQTLNGQGVLRIPGRNHFKLLKTEFRLATWNVRSLYEDGKLENVCHEMNRLKLQILGLSEMRWPNSGTVNIMDKTVYYSGNNDPDHYNGVGIILNHELSRAVSNFVPLSDRCMLLQITGSPININIIQGYAPIAKKKSIDELEQWYEDLDKLMKMTKKEDINIVLGDFNAKIGKGRFLNLVGEHGLGDRNDRGDRLLEFCQYYEMVIMNTWFKLPHRRLYTWTSPKHTANRIIRNQIDYILVNQRYRNAIKSVKTYPGADVSTDHNPVVANFHPRLKIVKRTKPPMKPNMECLKDITTRKKVATELNKNLLEIDRMQMSTSDDINKAWEPVKKALKNTTDKHLLKVSTKGKKDWMTTEILELMDKRRTFRNKNIAEYKRLNREIRAKIRTTKEEWLNNRCKEIEGLQEKHDYFNMYKKIKEFTHTNKKNCQHLLEDTNGYLINNTQDKLKEWEKYIKELFEDDRKDDTLEEIDVGLRILKCEVETAIQQLKANKSPGSDEIYPEMLKLINEDNIDLFVSLFNKIYDTGKIPDEWLESIFVPLPKQPHSRKCGDFRLISLMSHALKILLKLIHNRLFRKCEAEIGHDQFGFRSGMGTREALFSLQVLSQKCYDQQKDIFLCFVDFEKAFDRVNHSKMIDSLEDIGLDGKDLRLIRNLYWYQKAKIRVDGETSSTINIKRGVRQGCVLSPMLFNLYSEVLFKKAFEEINQGVKVNGVQIPSIRYADDTVLIADTDVGLQALLDRLTKTCDEYGMRINEKKTKIMVIQRKQNVPLPFMINNNILEQVNQFKYLGCWIDSQLNPEKEITSRIAQARTSFVKLRGLLCDSHLDINLRLRLTKCYIWSVLLYGVETWTLKTTSLNKLEAFEMWVYRRILKIPWTAKVRNEEVLRRVNRDRELLLTIKLRKTTYLGHLLRNPKYCIPQLIIKGKIDGKRGIGRKKLSWLRNIRNWTGLGFEELIRKAEDRNEFAVVIANLH